MRTRVKIPKPGVNGVVRVVWWALGWTLGDSGVQVFEARWGWFGLARNNKDRLVVTWFETGTNLEFGSNQKLRF